MNLRLPLALGIGILPDGGAKRALLKWLCGWDIDSSARISPCVLLNVSQLTMGPRSTLGCSVLWNIREITLAADAGVGHWNWISAAPPLTTSALASTPGVSTGRFSVGKSSGIASRHYIDCSGGVRIGEFTTMAGVRSTILTHQINTMRGEQELAAVAIGNYCLVGSNSKLVPGATVPDRCTVAMGSVVIRGLTEEGVLYAGVPARKVKDVAGGAYFHRSSKHVDIPQQ